VACVYVVPCVVSCRVCRVCGGSLEGLKEGLKNTGPLRQEVASTKASFSKDYKSVTATIEDLHRGKGEGGSWEICDGFDSMKTVTTTLTCCVLRVSCGFSSLGGGAFRYTSNSWTASPRSTWPAPRC
jgi:hypothetical protein